MVTIAAVVTVAAAVAGVVTTIAAVVTTIAAVVTAIAAVVTAAVVTAAVMPDARIGIGLDVGPSEGRDNHRENQQCFGQASHETSPCSE